MYTIEHRLNTKHIAIKEIIVIEVGNVLIQQTVYHLSGYFLW
jgi:hypothetical protein